MLSNLWHRKLFCCFDPVINKFLNVNKSLLVFTVTKSLHCWEKHYFIILMKLKYFSNSKIPINVKHSSMKILCIVAFMHYLCSYYKEM